VSNKRAKIVSAVVERMKTIKKINGYETNAGLKVTEWKLSPFGAAETVGLDVKDIVNKPDTEFKLMGRFCWRLQVKILIFSVKGVTTGAEIRSMIADVYKAIFTDVYWTVGGVKLATSTAQPQDNMLIDDQGKIIGDAEIDVEISYNTPKGEC